MTIQDILNLDWNDINRMPRTQLAKITSQLASAGNKRLRRLEKTEGGINSPAYRYIKGDATAKGRGLGDFSVKGKNQGQLKGEYMRLKGFLSAKTSSVSGFKKYKKRVEKEFTKKSGIENPTPKQIGDFWVNFHHFRELHPSDQTIKSNELMAEIGHMYKFGVNSDDIDRALNAKYGDLAKEEARKESQTVEDAMNAKYGPGWMYSPNNPLKEVVIDDKKKKSDKADGKPGDDSEQLPY